MISKHVRGVVIGVIVLAGAGAARAATIDVGDHTLDPNTAGQTIEIEVSDGGQLIDGINLLADIGEGSTGPTFEDVDLLTGTIFESEGGTQDGSRGDRFVDFSLVTENGTDVTLSDDPEALAMLTIDTSGLSDGRYALNLSDVEISGNVGDTELVHDGSASVPTINDGSIAIGETPTVTWTGGGEDAATTTGANWDGFASPRDGDAVVFAGGTDTTVQNDAEGGITLDSVTFDGSADPFTLQGNGITIADGGAVTNDSANAQTIDLNVASSSPMTFDAASGDLTFSGGVAINDGTLTVTGSNNTTINSGVTGNGSVDKTGGGTLVLDGQSPSFTGDLTLNEGTLRVDPNADLAQDVGLELAGGTFVNNIGQQANADQALTVSGDVAIDSGNAGIEFSGDTDLAGATRSIELLNASEGAFTEFSGPISNGGLELHGTGDETAVLSGNNTYGGGTTLENVTLGVGSDSALGSGAVDVNGTVTVAALDGAREIANTIQLNSTLAVAEDPDGAQDLTLSGGLTLNADSTLRAASSAASTVSGSVDLGSHTLSVEGAEDLTVSGNVSGSGGVTKADGGTLTLSGTNTYGGGTTVEAGTLAVTGSTGGNATVNGGELDLNGGDLGGDATINAGSLTLNNGGSVGGAATVHSGATLSGTGSLGDLNGTGGTISPGHSIGTLSVSGDADLDADTVLDLEVSLDGGTSADLLDVGGQATLTDGMALDVSQTGAGTFSGGETFDVLTADGGLSVDPSSLAINSAVDDVGFNAQLSGSTLQLTAELLDLATWTGGADPDGSWSTAGNWENDELPEDGDRLFFAGSTNLDTNNDLAGLTAADITFEQGAGAFTLDGQGLTLESGAAITNESASAQMIDLALTADGALTVDAAAGDLNINGAVSLGNQDLTVTGSHDTSLNGRISGSGGLVKTGDGALTLTTTNTYTGDTTVVGGELDIRGSVTSDVTLNAGRLTLGNGSAIDAANTLTLNGGTLTATGVTIGNDVTVGGDFAVDSGDSLTLDGAVGLGSADRALTVAGGGTDLTISGDVSGDAALTKAGAGSLTLSGTNSFGDLAVGGGSVSLNGGSALADDAALTLADASGVSVTLGADEAIGTLSGGGDSGGDLDLDGNQLRVNQAGDAAFAGQISSSTLGGTLVKQGEGRLTLDGTSTYTGGTTVEAGTLGVTNDEAIGTGELALAGGDIAAIGAEVTLDESVSVMSDFAVEDGGGALSLSGSIDLNGGMRTITLNDPDGTELAGNIANGGLTLTGGESGASVVLSGANTFSGGATLQNVTAGLGHDDALGDGGGVNLDGATLVARNGARTIDESVSLDGDATIAGR
jgi:autotransporter-associated beta strand protein